MNPDNDALEVYKDAAGEWRWRRVDSNNGKIVSESGEGYQSKSRATNAALSLNPDVRAIEVDLMIFGVDISRYQPASAMDGYSFVFINAEDPGFNAKVAHAREQGIPWGPYSWVYPGNGRADMQRAVDVCAPHGDPPMGYWLDYEQPGVTPSDIDAAFSRARDLGVLARTGVYTYLHVLNASDVENHLQDCPLWIAYYPGNNDGNLPPGQDGDANRYGAVIWQYTSGANAGVGLDKNVVIDEAWYHSWVGQSGDDDDMPYKSWPQEDKDALTFDVMMAVLGGLNNVVAGTPGLSSYGEVVKETLAVARKDYNQDVETAKKVGAPVVTE